MSTLSPLEARWRAAWPEALAAWSHFTQLREPHFFPTDEEAAKDGMAGEIAAIRLHDQAVMVNLEVVHTRGLEDDAVAVLAHEIGHHVYVPGNLADNGRMIAAMKPYLFGLPENTVHFVANLYGDLLLNDRLQRRSGVDIAAVYRKLNDAVKGQQTSAVWKVYTHTYEQLWRLPTGTLSPPGLNAEMKSTAAYLARLIRHFASDWLRGARRFVNALYPYLIDDQEKQQQQTFILLGLTDTRCAGKCKGNGSASDVIPGGLIGIDPSELGGDDDFERELDDLFGLGEREDRAKNRKGRGSKRDAKKADNTAPEKLGKGTPRSQFREPFEYGELLRALGLDLKDWEVTTRYYRERSLPYLIPFPARRAPQAMEPLPEGYETWESTDSLENLDVFGSLVRSPIVVPGLTTVQRVYGESPGGDPAKRPLDLDIYIDCSGSMPNPAVNVSYLALAGTILALSALRAGARVQATLWSGAGQFDTSGGFLRDEKRLLGILTGYIAGATAFPLHVLRDTYQTRKASEPPAHIVVISDEGVDTILAEDEKKTPGEQLCRSALQTARGGGTLVLNLPSSQWPPRKTLEAIGFRIHAVTDWEDLVAFARAFVRDNYK